MLKKSEPRIEPSDTPVITSFQLLKFLLLNFKVFRMKICQLNPREGI